MSQHTPGPWRLYKRRPSAYGQLTTTLQSNDGRMNIARLELRSEQDRANADLIAAAPELLEALKMARGYVREHGSSCGCPPAIENDIRRIDAAIQKAEGAL